MFTENRDYFDIAIGVIAAAIVVAGLLLFSMNRSSPTPSVAIPSPSPSPSPSTVDASQAREIDPPDSRVIARVYECMVDDQRILSDRPCGSDAIIREIVAPNRMVSPDTSILYESPRATGYSRGRSSAGGSPGAPSSVCDSIEEEIDAINARMRRGYRNREGEWLRERLRALSDARWEAGCRNK